MNIARSSILVTTVAAIAMVAGVATPTTAQGALLLPKVPLFVNLSTTPNIFMQMDDSGSMDWDIMTPTHFTTCRYNTQKGCDQVEATGEFYDWTGETDDGDRIYRTFEYVFSSDDDAYDTDCYDEDRDVIELCTRGRGSSPWDWRVRSTALNVLFFNPNVQYRPWPGYPNALFNLAHSNPDITQPGYLDLRNLSGFTYNHWIDDKGFAGSRPDKTDVTIGDNKIVDEWDSYVRVTVGLLGYSCTLHTSNPSRSGLNVTTSTLSSSDSRCKAALGINTSPSMLAQNVANWYQYYRRRAMVTKAAVSNVINDLPSFRYGLGMINNVDNFVEVPAEGINDFLTHNVDLITSLLSNEQEAVGTPLRRGLERIGKYYDDTLSGTDDPIISACQKNFTILFSDGYWNGDPPSTPSSDDDNDGGVIYGDQTVLLADVANYFYRRDLSPKPNLVPTDPFDTANHQHMVTYTVGFGISGSLVDLDGDGWPDNLNNGSKWYTSGATDNERVVDDLWHAAWNSKGKYISAARPEELAVELTNAILDISDRIGGAASGATNGGSISSSSKLFQAKFDAFDWHGELLAININSLSGELGGTAWEAGAVLDTRPNSWFQSGRKVFTINPSTQAGLDFTTGGITAGQRTLLDISPHTGTPDGFWQRRLNYVRGDSSYENSLFRARDHKLGDIGHSDPQYVGTPPFYYSLPGYREFAIANKDRPAMVYVGANDGMVHGFRELDGQELIAYVPNEIIHKLPDLTSKFYSHDYFVDGSPQYGDIQTATGWKSVLVGSLRSGGQGIYAIDITDPTKFTAANVMWEFTDEVDADLGYVFGQPQIRKLADGKWYAIFASGYNNIEADGHASSDGDSYLYLVSIEDGANGWSASDYRKIAIPGADGLSEPSVADVDGDHMGDFIYIGDLDGNMWKVDVTSSSRASWGLAFGGEPLFTAINADGSRQPITTKPAVMRHPLSISEGVLVLFGTGKYLEVNDDATAGVPTQSIYAIWDRDAFYNKAFNQRNNYGAHDFNRNQLKESEFVADALTGHRIIHDDYANSIDWFDTDGDPDSRGWFIDLPVEGERIVQRVILRDNIAFLVSLIPEEDVCSAGGTGWLMALDAETGAAPRFAVFDINDDNVIDASDSLIRQNPNAPPGSGPSVVNPVAMEMLSIPNLPAMLYDDRASDLGGVFPPRPNEPRGCGASGAKSFTYTTRTNGSIEMVAAAHQPLSCGRQSWDQKH